MVNLVIEVLVGIGMELFDYMSMVDVFILLGWYVIFWEMVDSSDLDYDVL